jgi:hypothetical protein
MGDMAMGCCWEMLQIVGRARMSMIDDDGILCRISGRDEGA